MSRQGVLDQNYAKERQKKLELVHRYKVRAKVVENAVRCYLGRADNLNILDFGAAEGLTLKELDRLLPRYSLDGQFVASTEARVLAHKRLPLLLRHLGRSDVEWLRELHTV